MIFRFSRLFFFIGAIVLMASCAVSPKRSVLKTYCRYTAASAVERNALPDMVYLFPPLLADAKGKPLQSMSPVENADGSIADWRCPSEKSREIRAAMKHHLETNGYQVVDFATVRRMEAPHSILMLSSFYAKPVSLPVKKEGDPDRSILTMIRAKTFDIDLNPATSRDISHIDGAVIYHSQIPEHRLEEKCFGLLLGWLGDNVTGYMGIEGTASTAP